MHRYSRLMRGLVLVAAVALTGTACDQGLTALNKNPNDPEAVPAENILPNAERSAVGRIFGVGWQLRMTGLWPQIYAEIQYPDEDRYILRPSAIQGYWDDFYANSLKDFQRIQVIGQMDGNPNYVAVATILKEWEFAAATDVWGDMPYSEALQGDSTGNFKPVYDPQSQIYADIMQQLKAANGMWDSSLPTFESADIIYGGDIGQWMKFANSLQLRYAMRMVNVDPGTAQTEFMAALNAPGGVIEDNADNAEFDYSTAYPNTNPWHEDWKGRDDYAMSATMIDTLLSLNDPRLSYYAEPTDSGPTYQGMPNGIPSTAPKLKAVSRIGDYWRANANGTFVLMGASEVLFLEAEAAVRGWIPGGMAQAAVYYNKAITQDMKKYEDDASGSYTPYATDAQIATYLAQPRIQLSTSPQTALDQIHLQMWIAFFANSAEAYATWRRTGIPHLQLAANASQAQIPVRIPYPDLEQSLNFDNWTAAVQAQGLSDGFSTPLWWDAPPQ